MTGIVTFIIKDVGRNTYGAIAYCGNECVWFSGDGYTYDEAKAKLNEWEAEHNEGAKA